MFIHFGVNTFNQLEWSDGSLPASSFNPTQLDCDQWIRTAKEAGFRHVILITKHHDGFCLWDSKYTEYDVGSAKVKTDIVAEVVAAENEISKIRVMNDTECVRDHRRKNEKTDKPVSCIRNFRNCALPNGFPAPRFFGCHFLSRSTRYAENFPSCALFAERPAL